MYNHEHAQIRSSYIGVQCPCVSCPFFMPCDCLSSCDCHQGAHCDSPSFVLFLLLLHLFLSFICCYLAVLALVSVIVLALASCAWRDLLPARPFTAGGCLCLDCMCMGVCMGVFALVLRPLVAVFVWRGLTNTVVIGVEFITCTRVVCLARPCVVHCCVVLSCV